MHVGNAASLGNLGTGGIFLDVIWGIGEVNNLHSVPRRIRQQRATHGMHQQRSLFCISIKAFMASVRSAIAGSRNDTHWVPGLSRGWSRPSSGVSWRNLRDRRVFSIEVCRLAAKGAGMQLQVCKNCLSKTREILKVHACNVYASCGAKSDPCSADPRRAREHCRRWRRRGRVRHQLE